MVKTELEYVGRFGDTFLAGVGTVKRGGIILVETEQAKELVEKRPKEWKFPKAKTSGKTKKGASL